jgi:hypothetical protein
MKVYAEVVPKSVFAVIARVHLNCLAEVFAEALREKLYN